MTLVCLLHGHQWGPWHERTWSDVWGKKFRVRWCDQCDKRQARRAA